MTGFLANSQHYPLLSQYTLNGMPSNPGFTGSDDVLSVFTSYRNQWVGFDGAPVTQTIGAHTPLKNENVALGILLYRDVIGKHYDNGVYFNYAYRVKTGSGKLSLGLSSGISLKQSRLADATVIQQGDIVYSNNTPVNVLPDFSFGAYYYTQDYYAGFSLPFMMTHELDVSKGTFTPKHYFSEYNILLTAGYKFKVNEELYLLPSFVDRLNVSSGNQFEFCMAADYRELVGFGISYRLKDAVIAMFKYQINNQLTFGYSFDITISKLKNYNSGTHELVLRYIFKYESKSKSPRFFH